MSTSTQCLECKHYLGGWICAAFPEGIPAEVATGLHDHEKPYPGDRGIRWEPWPDGWAKADSNGSEGSEEMSPGRPTLMPRSRSGRGQ